MERHKARLSAEFTKARLRRGFASIEDLRAHIDAVGDIPVGRLEKEATSSGTPPRTTVPKLWPHPRWVRVNTLKTDMKEQLNTTFAGYRPVETLEELIDSCASYTNKVFHVDKHIPNLLALPPTVDLSRSSAYLNGLIILQDKASCFPAYLLDLRPDDGDCVDACAAPGNKTTHLAALKRERGIAARKPTIYACERDKDRALTLKHMLHTAGAQADVIVKPGQDFLRIDPTQPLWENVGALLLDPSCSGSGIMGRDDTLKIVLPKRLSEGLRGAQSKKRKRNESAKTEPIIIDTPEVHEEVPIRETESSDLLSTRLAALSTFQLKLLSHALEFPKARKITYSTCSTYAQENEHVVIKALESATAKRRGWRILRRDEQVYGMRSWTLRGDLQACREISATANIEQIAEACIRCEKETKEGTQGFFVVAFVRDPGQIDEPHLSEDEWDGCSADGGGS